MRCTGGTSHHRREYLTKNEVKKNVHISETAIFFAPYPTLISSLSYLLLEATATATPAAPVNWCLSCLRPRAGATWKITFLQLLSGAILCVFRSDLLAFCQRRDRIVIYEANLRVWVFRSAVDALVSTHGWQKGENWGDMFSLANKWHGDLIPVNGFWGKWGILVSPFWSDLNEMKCDLILYTSALKLWILIVTLASGKIYWANISLNRMKNVKAFPSFL